MNILTWKEFKLNDYFKMSSGKHYPKDSFNNGNIPLISASDNNNGVSYKTDLKARFEGNAITIGKVGLTAFYQKLPFCATSDVTILEPNFKNIFNEYIGLFIITILKLESNKWSYGRQIRLGDCKKLKINLPAKNGEPDWEFMENYIKNIKNSFDIPNFKYNNINLNINTWSEYKIKDIFECTTGNGFIDKININKNNNGINYVTRTAMNNGVEMKISPKNLENKINNGNCITIGAESVTCFYQKDDFIKGEKVSILRNNNINIYTALFICTVMHTNIKNKFSYSRALNLSRLKELTIKLPTKDGQPDWEFMENYMKEFIKE